MWHVPRSTCSKAQNHWKPTCGSGELGGRQDAPDWVTDFQCYKCHQLTKRGIPPAACPPCVASLKARHGMTELLVEPFLTMVIRQGTKLLRSLHQK
jgi:hypothetical protein